MVSDSPLPRTPIEWFMLAPVLVVLNGVVLLATGHTLFEAVVMGAFYGLAIALVILLVAVGWQSYRGSEDSTDPDSLE